MQESQYEIEVLVNGKPVQEYSHQGKIFIEGKEGTEFSLRLRNRSNKRALFVPTIDGLSVMTGKEASFESSGYIVSAYSTEAIDGWRTSDDDVAKFFFAKVAESYAARTGKGGNVGIIGCAVFKEKELPPQPIVIKEYIPMPIHPRCPWAYHYGNGNCNSNGIYLGGYYASSTGMGMSGASLSGTHTSATFTVSNNAQSQMMAAAKAQSSLGTGFGEQKHSPVRTVSFERADKMPETVLAIHYNTRQNLEEMGVEFKRTLYAAPSAFPKENGYCQPPQD